MYRRRQIRRYRGVESEFHLVGRSQELVFRPLIQTIVKI